MTGPCPTEDDAMNLLAHLRNVDQERTIGGGLDVFPFYGGPLSNWCLTPSMRVWDLDFRTAEHAMMRAKADLFGDAKAAADIMAAYSPARAKAIGRRVRDYNDGMWSMVRYEIVLDILREKFKDPLLADDLHVTGTHIIVEASPTDKVWGVGLPLTQKLALRHPLQWRGRNLLGFALMQVRAEL